ncbi:MAG: UDP-N-acetylmuramoyl-tripeptide--D-alanyl-D-alanine ligase [Acidobacteria bacterium]|nr:UDP-N-acetylmuramoyl-tripeptide--D-alanyl-D-alanine ligase [Acidobacteriota bacterium]
MSLWSLERVGRSLQGRVAGDASVVPGSLSLDTRTLRPGACFVALKGARDGHAFAKDALSAGAAALLVDHELDLPIPQLIVRDTLEALQAWGRLRLEEVRPRQVFAVTGSVGKTTTKELLAAATGGWKTPGNRNNTLGLPEALATIPEGLESAVLEMGMSFPGEIETLCRIAPPDWGLLTCVGTAHVENFPDGQEGIARAKGELVAGLRSGGTWVHLESDPWAAWIAAEPWAAEARAVRVGERQPFGWSEVRSLGPRGSRFLLRTDAGEVEVALRLPGLHNVRNAALAGSLAALAGHPLGAIAAGLGSVEPEAGRGRLHALGAGGWLLDESYNASPDSMLACAAALLDLPGGEPVAVLGAMRELGAEAGRLHRDTGAGLRAAGLARLWAFGDHAADLAGGFGPDGAAFPDFETLRDDPAGLAALPRGARILVKGSRFWRSERAVDWILNRHPPQD